MRRRMLILTALGAVLVLAAAVAARASTSHRGWPKRTGILAMNKTDRPNWTRHGTRRNDELLGGHASETIYGEAGDDVIWGDYKPGNQPTSQVDHLDGGSGRDFIYASHGLNFIHAGAGNDVIHAHFGHGRIDCGSGRDVLFISHRSRPHYRVHHCDRISYKTLGY